MHSRNLERSGIKTERMKLNFSDDNIVMKLQK